MVNVCAGAPAVAEEGERLTMLGMGFDVGGVEELLPPPPQDRRMANANTTRIEIIMRRMAYVLNSTTFVSCDIVRDLAAGFAGTSQR